ncbi:hypothetical protein Zm00014a_020557 [Zea mays]|uniref:Uncharacterized protein n=1 Tax=Zea mays TaxID=4577 RepID=A0A3L6DMM7_MAIZE|nr:hypothetical protein Zm00014a_020557 [Zea mays]
MSGSCLSDYLQQITILLSISFSICYSVNSVIHGIK